MSSPRKRKSTSGSSADSKTQRSRSGQTVERADSASVSPKCLGANSSPLRRGGRANPPDATGVGGRVVRDDSNDGGPFFPGSAGAGFASGAGSDAGDGGDAGVGSNEELIIEVEFVPGAATRGLALASSVAGLQAGAGDAAAAVSGLGAVLRQLGLREARPVFTADHVQRDEAHIASVRSAAAMGAASLDQLGAMERLPSLSSFLRLRFPPGTAPAVVTTALNRLPEVARAVAVPRAMPPMPVVTQPAPRDRSSATATVPWSRTPPRGWSRSGTCTARVFLKRGESRAAPTW
jgi:hypothetical protein